MNVQSFSPPFRTIRRLLWLVVLPAAAGHAFAATSGGPGDLMPDFFIRDAALAPPDDLSHAPTVRALAWCRNGDLLVAGLIQGSGIYGQPAGLWRIGDDGIIRSTPAAPFIEGTEIKALAVLPDGKVLAGGNLRFDKASFRPNYRPLARLLPDLRADPTFTNAAGLTFRGGAGVLAVAGDSAGRVWVGGAFTAATGAATPGLVRLNPDGARDESYASPLRAERLDGGSVMVRRLVPLRQGGWLVAGWFATADGRRLNLVKLTEEGAVDEGFDAGPAALGDVRDVAEASDGSLWVTDGALHRLLPEGAPHPEFPASFTPRSGINALLVEGDSVWVAGRFSRVQGSVRHNLAFLHADGTIATNTPAAVIGGPQLGAFPELFALARRPAGGLVVAGDFGTINTGRRKGFARLEADGTTDANFPRTGLWNSAPPSLLLPAPGGRVLVGGGFHEFGGVWRPGLAMLHRNGALAADFNPGGAFAREVLSAPRVEVASSNGTVLTSGYLGNPARTRTLVRLLPDGSRDPAFGPDGTDRRIEMTSAEVSALAVQADGAVLVGGRLTGWGLPAASGLHRLHSDGRADSSFAAELRGLRGDGGGVSHILVEPDGRIVAGGSGLLVRLGPDGRRELDFTAAWPALTNRTVAGLWRDADGGLVVSTRSHSWSGDVQTVKLRPDGTRNPLFIEQRFLLYGGWPDGRLLMGTDGFAKGRGDLLRCFSNGAPDWSFSLTFSNALVRSAAVDEDGTVLVALSGTTPRSEGVPRLLRYRADSPTLSRLGRQGIRLSGQINGPPDRQMMLESSTDLRNWAEVLRVTMPQVGVYQVSWTNSAPAAEFFRARLVIP